MRDVLKEFIEDYNEGRITLETLENRLSFDMWAKDKKKYLEIYLDQDVEPLENMVKEERLDRITDALLELKAYLSKSDWDTIVMVSQGKSYKEICSALNITGSTITNRLGRIRHMAEYAGLKELLEPVTPIYEAHEPIMRMSYPMDIAKNHIEKNRLNRDKKVCRIPEYLRECNCESVCTICPTCKRKDLNK